MRWDFWERAKLFLRPGTRVLFTGAGGRDPRFPLTPEDGPFDVVLLYHVPYDLAELHSLLKPGGFFLTEQLGGTPPDYNLENQAPLVKKAGFRVVYADQSYEGGQHRFIITAGRRKNP